MSDDLIHELKAQICSIEETYKLQNQNIKKFIEELREILVNNFYAEDIDDLIFKYFPQITNQSHLTNPELDSVSRTDEDNTSEQNKSSEGSNAVEQTEMTGSVSEVNNLGCGKELTYEYHSEGSSEIKIGKLGKCGDKKGFPNGDEIKLCKDCQAKQEKENGSTK
jgi:hypothetical protein